MHKILPRVFEALSETSGDGQIANQMESLLAEIDMGQGEGDVFGPDDKDWTQLSILPKDAGVSGAKSGRAESKEEAVMFCCHP